MNGKEQRLQTELDELYRQHVIILKRIDQILTMKTMNASPRRKG